MTRIEIVGTLTAEGRLTAQVPSMVLDFQGDFHKEPWSDEIDRMVSEGLLMWIHANGKKADRLCKKGVNERCRKSHYLYMTPKGIETFARDLYPEYANIPRVNAAWKPVEYDEFVAALLASAHKAMGA